MVCAAGCGRIVLVVVNSITLLVGMGLLAIGCVIKFYISDYIINNHSGLITDITRIAFSLFIRDQTVPDTIDFGPLTNNIGIGFIVVGSFLIVVSLAGCCAVCCSFRALLIAFCVMLGLLILTQIIFYSCFLPRDSLVHKEARKKLQEEMRNDYNRINLNPITLSADVIFLAAECCGVEGPEDFHLNSHLKFNFTINSTYIGEVDDPTVPPSCCKHSSIAKLDWACTKDSNKYYSKGCYTALQDLLDDWKSYTITGVVLTLLVQVLEMVAAILIYKDGDKSNIV